MRRMTSVDESHKVKSRFLLISETLSLRKISLSSNSGRLNTSVVAEIFCSRLTESGIEASGTIASSKMSELDC